ncbi:MULTISPECIES: hypothetical protein [Halolamina]|uniref:Uncharacterized protein n=1 Tax=Halolamina pelagica TaxID=699431 RepID=A0A1I5UL34_9EURY|nr:MULTISPECIES: hypothetical protein [Halolamina]NHX37586.1 hypothetical protein [Halolamina sp. R1-12]SFP95879.1 hypothetical protein SAMN05216277_11322 [Halolamina pelagica]
MKKGTGDDPFADEEPEESEDEQSAEEPSAVSEPSMSDSEPASPTRETATLPYYQRRSSVKEDRDDVLQFFVREDTAQGEDDLERAVADELDIRPKELYKLDLREAALLVAMEHPDEVADKLREWGYEHV